ncbi:uncharacterized protein EDB93DRAFT_1109201 [Suillus bovinus]|uniref:uncharacterized protein n=1 Tax=Suillus bovinus TaxID=48563 RepID=UPI001B87F98E|nr:uncharacterized protein EDB93DRAFT_1109201 [Suillus bovinus]KAG2127646.1 hypothetical protein EDB93DRAFT_1109201 [Suillus bovinus]
MSTDYSADDIAAAMSLLFFQLSFSNYFLGGSSVHRPPNELTNMSSCKMPGVGQYLLRVQHAISCLLRMYPSLLTTICFFILRTCALWSNNRILFAAILVTAFTFVGASIGVTFATTAPATYAISAIPGIAGCYQSSTSLQLFIPFLLLCAFELELAAEQKP